VSIKTAFSSIAIMAAAFLSAPSFGANSYQVTALIEHGDELVGQPSVIVRPGAPASVAVHGEGGYNLTVTVIPGEEGLLDVTVKAETSRGSVSTAVTTSADKPIVTADGEVTLTLTIASVGA
jgi:hypothetical protein